MIRRLAITAVVMVAGLTAACGGTGCEKPKRYAGSGELSPVQVPDDLTPPNESRSLRIPQASDQEPPKVARKGPCLESPPDYFEGRPPQ